MTSSSLLSPGGGAKEFLEETVRNVGGWGQTCVGILNLTSSKSLNYQTTGAACEGEGEDQVGYKPPSQDMEPREL